MQLIFLVPWFTCLPIYAEVLRTDQELVESLPVTDGQIRQALVVYSLGPINLTRGELIDVRLQAVVSSECRGNTGVGRYLIRTTNSRSVNGKRVTKAVMSNTTRDIHHGVLVHSGIEEITSPLIGQYYNFVVFAQSTQCAGTALNVEGFGDRSIGEMVLVRQKQSVSYP